MFIFLTGEIKRKIGLKALEMGGNAVIGYCFFFVLLFSDIIKSSRNERILEVSNTFSIE